MSWQSQSMPRRRRVLWWAVTLVLALIQPSKAQPSLSDWATVNATAIVQLSAALASGTPITLQLSAGRFAVSETLRLDLSSAQRPVSVSIVGQGRDQTVLDCGGLTQALRIWGAASITLGNVTVQNCVAGPAPWGGGAGAWLHGSDNITVVGCAFSGNTVGTANTDGVRDSWGGALLIASPSQAASSVAGSVRITECVFTNNTAQLGGGVYTIGASPVLIDTCIFQDNAASYAGGGLGVQEASGPVSVTNCVFTRNTAQGFGGGLVLVNASKDSSMLVSNTQFVDNSAGTCAAISVSPASTITFTSNALVGNAGQSALDDNQCASGSTVLGTSPPPAQISNPLPSPSASPVATPSTSPVPTPTPTPAPAPTPASAPPSSSSSLNLTPGAMFGIIFGAVAGSIVVAAQLIFICPCGKRRNSSQVVFDKASSTTGDSPLSASFAAGGGESGDGDVRLTIPDFTKTSMASTQGVEEAKDEDASTPRYSPGPSSTTCNLSPSTRIWPPVQPGAALDGQATDSPQHTVAGANSATRGALSASTRAWPPPPPGAGPDGQGDQVTDSPQRAGSGTRGNLSASARAQSQPAPATRRRGLVTFPSQVEMNLVFPSPVRTKVYKEEALSRHLIPWASVKQGRVLGRGGFGVVYQGQWQGDTVAIKTLNVTDLPSHIQNELRREAILICELRHPRLSQVHGLVEDSHMCALVLKYYKGGALSNVLPQLQEVPFAHRLRMALQVANGMSALHECGLVHGNLKTSNLLIDNDEHTVVITDFGLACLAGESAKRGAMTVQITPPEVLLSPYEPRTRAGDVYAFGIVLLEIMAGTACYKAMPRDAVKRAVLEGQRPDLPSTLPAQVRDLIAQCWAEDPAVRPAFKEIVSTLDSVVQQDNEETAQTGEVNPQGDYATMLQTLTARGEATRSWVIGDSRRRLASQLRFGVTQDTGSKGNLSVAPSIEQQQQQQQQQQQGQQQEPNA